MVFAVSLWDGILVSHPFIVTNIITFFANTFIDQIFFASEPAYEVTHWDGLQHIKNPEQYPFYHVIPDRNDVMVAFGGERPWRYVCEENLQVCPEDERSLDIDLEPEWTIDPKNGKYQSPDDLLLRHGGALDDDGVTQDCLKEMKVWKN